MNGSPLKIIRPISPKGLKIPVGGTITGIKYVPLLGIANNNITQRFMLFEDHAETKVIFTRRCPISEIQRVDVISQFGATNLEISWKSSLLSFIAVFKGEALLSDVVRFFSGKGVTLGEKVQSLINAKTPLF